MVDCRVMRVPGLRLASVLFFSSGATGLAYEVIWFRRFSHIWGSSTLAMGAVVASFLLGLGIGAHVLGRTADRMKVPLKGYAWCELGIGLLALLIPLESGLLLSISGALYPALHGLPLLYTLVRLLLTFLVIGPPCFLMGGTFPLLVRQFTSPSGSLGPATGWIYAVNTGGAALGCYLAGFHLLPALGLSVTNLLSAGVNGAVALGAFALARTLRTPEAQVPVPAPGPAAAFAAPPVRTLYGVAAMTGLASLLLQMVWARQLSVLLGGSTYALTSTLFVILLGIGVGSLLFRARVDRLAEPAHSAIWALAILAVSAGAGKMLIPEMTEAVGHSRALRSLEFGNAAVCVAASVVLEFVPSVCMGYVFPLLVHLTRRSAPDAGRAVGNVYAWNTAGSILGAAATAPLGLALGGSGITMAGGLALYLVSAILLAPLRNRRDAAVLAAAGVLAVAGVALGARRLDRRVTDQGMYLYGYRDPETRNLIYFKEGASCNVAVVEHLAHVSLSVNGKVDATNSGDMDMQLAIAYFPRFLRPRAESVLIIGYGSGTTVGASLLFPGTRVTCCEIEPAVYGASEHFAEVNHEPHRRPDLKMLFDDGRSHLQGTREKYDLILSEPSNPWLAGVSSLFTREFYETCRARLSERGVLAQWLQMYSFSEAEYALVVRTLTSVFPHACLLRVSSGDSMILASRSPLLPSRAEIDAAQALVDASPEIREDLEQHLGGSDVRSNLVSRMLLDEAGLRKVGARDKGTAVNTDVNLRLEFDAPLRLFHADAYSSDDEMDPMIVQAAEAAWFSRMIEAWGCGKAQVKALRSLAEILSKHKQFSVAVEVLDRALAIDPDDGPLLADRAIATQGVDVEALDRAVERLLARAPEEASRVGVELWRISQNKQAVRVFERIAAAHPQSPTTWENLAVNFEKLEELDKAEEAYKKALSLDPLSDSAHKAYEDLKKKRGKAKGKGEGKQPGK
jgi:spermidine synthase